MYSEFLATAVLLFVVFALADSANLKPPQGTQPFAMFITLLAIGSSLGYNTGYAINGARDTGPRIALWLVGYGAEVWTHDSWYWAWNPAHLLPVRPNRAPAPYRLASQARSTMASRPPPSSAAAGPSRTLTLTSAPAAPTDSDAGILRLRPAASASSRSQSRRVVWTDSTVDNEHLGKKKSKICCIYHKPKAFDESSDESSSGSDSSESDSSEEDGSESSADEGPNVSQGLRDKLKHRKHGHQHEHGEGCDGHAGKAKGKAKGRTKSSGGTQTITTTKEEQQEEQGDSDDERQNGRPNAYERGTR
uniref:Type 1 phosphatases regulator n=2 Tax=Kalmanozyma brasiliensis (strain GHG001) TaxID=1365824 RepID=V5EXZ7_KALBG